MSLSPTELQFENMLTMLKESEELQMEAAKTVQTRRVLKSSSRQSMLNMHHLSFVLSEVETMSQHEYELSSPVLKELMKQLDHAQRMADDHRAERDEFMNRLNEKAKRSSSSGAHSLSPLEGSMSPCNDYFDVDEISLADSSLSIDDPKQFYLTDNKVEDQLKIHGVKQSKSIGLFGKRLFSAIKAKNTLT
ncbi:hypothetical protein MP638_006807 [Amoeboaphelidium occidentale]|nr:hypothetical protein MP638_006807 [Amoeboaphelidium occidentale]